VVDEPNSPPAEEMISSGAALPPQQHRSFHAFSTPLAYSDWRNSAISTANSDLPSGQLQLPFGTIHSQQHQEMPSTTIDRSTASMVGIKKRGRPSKKSEHNVLGGLECGVNPTTAASATAITPHAKKVSFVSEIMSMYTCLVFSFIR